jgi:hypothetical protein
MSKNAKHETLNAQIINSTITLFAIILMPHPKTPHNYFEKGKPIRRFGHLKEIQKSSGDRMKV